MESRRSTLLFHLGSSSHVDHRESRMRSKKQTILVVEQSIRTQFIFVNLEVCNVIYESTAFKSFESQDGNSIPSSLKNAYNLAKFGLLPKTDITSPILDRQEIRQVRMFNVTR